LRRQSQLEPTVVELNHETVRELLAQGFGAVHGDASQCTILEAAGVREAASFIFAASGTPAEAVISVAKELNPEIRILARASYLREGRRSKMPAPISWFAQKPKWPLP
jgi:CPA2 family monovalent cation:H+ antiporter-2